MRNTPTTPKTIVNVRRKRIFDHCRDDRLEDEKRDDFPTGEAGQVMPEKKRA